MKTLGKSPLDINLTKWLSRCEGSFHKGKDQKTRYGANGCKAQLIKTKIESITMKETKTMNIKWKAKMKENGRSKVMENESDVHAT